MSKAAKGDITFLPVTSKFRVVRSDSEKTHHWLATVASPDGVRKEFALVSPVSRDCVSMFFVMPTTSEKADANFAVQTKELDLKVAGVQYKVKLSSLVNARSVAVDTPCMLYLDSPPTEPKAKRTLVLMDAPAKPVAKTAKR